MNLTNHYPSLAGKTVFITGGATGIGASLVEAFSRQRSKVAFVDIQDEPAQALIRQLSGIDGAVVPRYFHCDLLELDALRSVVTAVNDELGPISVLVNNAANDTRHDFRTISEAYWSDCININMRHSFFAIQAVYAGMKAQGGGAIINLGSMSWYECQGNMTGYTTAKAGLEGMTRGLARDLGSDNIRINTLIPGWVMTERQLRDWVDESTAQEIHRNQCIKSRLMPQDISAMALFLASDDSRMCTAQNFIVDGGWI